MRLVSICVARGGLAALLADTVAPCPGQRQRFAPGFSLANLSRLSVGISIADARAIMGEPVWEAHADDGTSGLWYADPGAKSSLGDYRAPDTGVACSLWFEADKLSNAEVEDIESGQKCRCDAASCDSQWAVACFDTLRAKHLVNAS